MASVFVCQCRRHTFTMISNASRAVVAANFLEHCLRFGLIHDIVQDDAQSLSFVVNGKFFCHRLQPGDMVVVEFKCLLYLDATHCYHLAKVFSIGDYDAANDSVNQ